MKKDTLDKLYALLSSAEYSVKIAPSHQPTDPALVNPKLVEADACLTSALTIVREELNALAAVEQYENGEVHRDNLNKKVGK